MTTHRRTIALRLDVLSAPLSRYVIHILDAGASNQDTAQLFEGAQTRVRRVAEALRQGETLHALFSTERVSAHDRVCHAASIRRGDVLPEETQDYEPFGLEEYMIDEIAASSDREDAILALEAGARQLGVLAGALRGASA